MNWRQFSAGALELRRQYVQWAQNVVYIIGTSNKYHRIHGQPSGWCFRFNPAKQTWSIRIIVPDRTEIASSPVRGFKHIQTINPIDADQNLQPQNFQKMLKPPGSPWFPQGGNPQNSVVSQRLSCATKEQIMLKGLTPPDQSVDRIKENVLWFAVVSQRIIMGFPWFEMGHIPLVLWRFYMVFFWDISTRNGGFTMGKSWENHGNIWGYPAW